MRKNSNSVFIWLALILALILLAPNWIGQGMFVDGVTYATIARNMSEGLGSFWKPYYTATLYPEFYEHPPLAIGILSLFFRILGDHFWVEKLYSALCFLASGYLIYRLWKRSSGQKGATAWLPLLLWILIPVVNWAYGQNMLENTMGIFCLLAVYFLIKGMDECRLLAFSLPAALCIAAAFLSKGPVSLFPLVVPAIYAITVQRRQTPLKKAVWLSLQTISFLLLASFLLYFWKGATANIHSYFRIQFFPSLEGQREANTHSRLWFLWGLFNQLLPLIVIGVLAILPGRLYAPLKHGAGRRQKNYGLFFLLLALCASLPVMISPKQAMHYILPAMPFFALGAALWIWPSIQALMGSRLYDRIFVSLRNIMELCFWLIIVGGGLIAFMVRPLIIRSKAEISLVNKVAEYVPEGETLGICPEMQDEWGYHAWFARMRHISLEAKPGGRAVYILDGPACPETPHVGYAEVSIFETNASNAHPTRFRLYKKLDTQP